MARVVIADSGRHAWRSRGIRETTKSRPIASAIAGGAGMRGSRTVRPRTSASHASTASVQRSQRRRDIQRATLLGNGLIGVVTRKIYCHVRVRARQAARRSGPVVVVDGSAYKE